MESKQGSVSPHTQRLNYVDGAACIHCSCMCDSLCQTVTMNGHSVVLRDYAFYRAVATSWKWSSWMQWSHNTFTKCTHLEGSGGMLPRILGLLKIITIVLGC